MWNCHTLSVQEVGNGNWATLLLVNGCLLEALWANTHILLAKGLSMFTDIGVFLIAMSATAIHVES